MPVGPVQARGSLSTAWGSILAVQLLTVSDCAERANLSAWAIRRAIHEGELPASKLRGRLRIDAVDFQGWIDGCRVQPAPRRRPDLPTSAEPSPVAPEAGSFRARLREERRGER